ncbi:MAG: chromate transporter [Desulfovibrionales bacterium]|nr:chromate transporter [Desulfovibrionales bacterium]
MRNFLALITGPLSSVIAVILCISCEFIKLNPGGGYAMVPLLQKQPVQNHHWLTNKESIDAIAIGQVTPRK